MHAKPVFALPLVLIVVAAVGCANGTADQLAGRWVGKPDTPAAQAQRESDKYSQLGGQATDVESPAGADDQRPPVVTDWQQHDVTVTLEFLSASRVRLALSGATTGAPVEGEWEIAESGPAGVVIEIRTPDADDGPPTRRRFELGLDERDAQLVGFTLHEVGADRRLGSLYFQRPDAK